MAEVFSNNSLGVADVTLVDEGETPRFKLLDNGGRFLPSRHTSGQVVVTEACFREGDSLVEYRRLVVLTSDGGTAPVTPCSHSIDSPGGFTWIEEGQLSPSGRRLVAQLISPGDPPIAVVFEAGQEIARFEGYGRSAWIDEETLALAGSTLVTATLGGELSVLNPEATGSLGAIAVSPDGSRLVFERNFGLWVMNVDGSELRELLPPNLYVFPAWSPDGNWVATIQHERPSALDAQVLGAVGAGFVYTNLKTLTLVNVDSGELAGADLSTHLGPSEMPQGRLSWY